MLEPWSLRVLHMEWADASLRPKASSVPAMKQTKFKIGFCFLDFPNSLCSAKTASCPVHALCLPFQPALCSPPLNTASTLPFSASALFPLSSYPITPAVVPLLIPAHTCRSLLQTVVSVPALPCSVKIALAKCIASSTGDWSHLLLVFVSLTHLTSVYQVAAQFVAV